MFGVTARDANFSGADLTEARPIGDFKGANLSGAMLVNLKGGADIKNQSMGLMRAVFVSVNLSGANLTGATVAGADFRNVDVSGARLVALKGQDSAKDWAARVNVDRAITQASN